MCHWGVALGRRGVAGSPAGGRSKDDFEHMWLTATDEVAQKVCADSSLQPIFATETKQTVNLVLDTIRPTMKRINIGETPLARRLS